MLSGALCRLRPHNAVGRACPSFRQPSTVCAAQDRTNWPCSRGGIDGRDFIGGGYIPRYRLSRKEIGSMWGLRSAEGDKAVAGYDEDAVTMAVAAALDCMKRNTKKVGAIFRHYLFPLSGKAKRGDYGRRAGSRPPLPYRRLCELPAGGLIALKAAMDAVKSGSAEQMLVTASDCRVSAPKGRFEPTLGDGAAALMIGSTDLVASLEGVYSIFSDFTDLWRTQDDAFLQYGESRFMMSPAICRSCGKQLRS